MFKTELSEHLKIEIKMIKFDVTGEKIIANNPNWPYIPDCPYKTNALLHLINYYPYIDKRYL